MPQILEELNVKDLEFAGDIARLEESGYVLGSEGDYVVAIPLEVSPELQAEGMAREIVHRLQTMRRSAGFDIADHIITCYQGDDYIKQVIAGSADYIKQETLSRQLIEGEPETNDSVKEYELNGHKIKLGVRKEVG